jgi:hypothetical protein
LPTVPPLPPALLGGGWLGPLEALQPKASSGTAAITQAKTVRIRMAKILAPFPVLQQHGAT